MKGNVLKEMHTSLKTTSKIHSRMEGNAGKNLPPRRWDSLSWRCKNKVVLKKQFWYFIFIFGHTILRVFFCDSMWAKTSQNECFHLEKSFQNDS